jgi:cobalt/nickel transport system permease protein
MHMADALLSPAVGGIMCAVSAASVVYSAAKVKKDELGEKKVPIMAVTGAFVFAAQMINFTIPATGSSGHIGGGILLSAVLGPFPALLSIAAVLIIQCLFFADGGLLALGCNIFNMGVIPCLIIYPLIYRPILRKGADLKRISASSVLSVVVGLELGAFAVVLQTLASGITELPFAPFVALMLPIHLAIGLIEGIVTAAIVSFIYKMRPEIITSAVSGASLGKKVSIKKVAIILAAATILIGGGLSLLASSNPDGLEWAMEKTAGTAELETSGEVHTGAASIQDATAFMPDYDYSDSDGDSPISGTTAAGLAGGAMTFLLAGAAGFIISRVKKKKAKA